MKIIMKKLTLLFSSLLLTMTAVAQDYTHTLSGIVTEITFYSPQIIRVTKYQANDAQAKTDPKMVVTMTPQAISTKISEGTISDTIYGGEAKITYNKKLGLVSFYRNDGSLLIKEKSKAVFTKRTSHVIDPYNVAQTFTLTNDEAIYGFGQVQDGRLNHRGASYSHMVQNNMSVWMPFFHSTKGYGLYWDLYGPCDFSDSSTGGATLKSEAAHAVDYYVLIGSKTDGDDVVRRMRELTGQATMVPLWTYGYAQSKERYKSANETLGVLKKYRSLGVPIDCVVQDWQYWGGNNQWNAMEFLNPEFKNDYRTMIDGVHNDGGHLLISIWANFGRDTKQFAHYKEKNQLMKMGDKIMSKTWPNNEGVGIYNPYQKSARDYYWQCLTSGLVEKGVDAYWVDSSEPDHYQDGEDWETTNDFIVLGNDPIDDATLNPHSTEATHTWRSVRNAFPLMHASGVYNGHRAEHSDMTEAKRVMIMTRSGFPGMQRYGAGTWSGDITSSWETLANQIPAALNYSACGIPSWNSDIGGFFNGNYSGAGQNSYNELYARWIQFGAFCTIMRSHGSGADRAIYQFGSEGETYFDIIARYINLRYSLLPYIYSTARRVHADGYSFLRAMGIAYPTDASTHNIKDQFMFGRDILVAPVLKSGAESRSIYLPSGDNWTDVWTGEKCAGGNKITREVSLSLMPLYVRQGTIMPWGPKVQYSNESNWDNLEIRIYPGANGKFTLYEDERDNYNYEKGMFTEIPFEWNDASNTLTIGKREGAYDGMLKERTFRIVLVDKDKSLGLGINPSARFSKIVKYNGESISMVIDNDNLQDTDTPVLKSITTNTNSISFYPGQTKNLKVTAAFADGTSRFVTLDIESESTNEEVAFIKDGIVKAGNGIGHADLTVRYKDAHGNEKSTQIGVDVTYPSNIYAWKAYDWYRNRVADRLSASDIKCNTTDNTITITKKGAQNIALRYTDKQYLTPGMKYLVAIATNVSTNKNDSQLWYINGNWVNIVNPTNVYTLKDGKILVAWAIEENKSYVETGETVFGMTSTNANGTSVISYVGFVADLNSFIEEQNKATATSNIKASSNKSVRIFSLNGTEQKNMTDGVNIVLTADNQSRKVMK